MTQTDIIDWALGDHSGLEFPAHAEALKAGGAAFLTRAFRACGALSPDTNVTRVAFSDELWIGGSGPKMVLTVDYDRADPGLSRKLFVKFSRCFTQPTRDRARFHMEPEVQLALLARDPQFPVAVPKCAFADFEHASGTGILITDCIPFGEGPVESQYDKHMDHVLPDPLGHYAVLVETLALLAGSHKAGKLSPQFERAFPWDPDAYRRSLRNPFDESGLISRVNRLADFVSRYPHLFEPHLANSAFLDAFRADAARLIAREDDLLGRLLADPDMIALCHWNGNIDNAWFWRNEHGTLACGLLDWGSVGQMHVVQTIWGALAGAELPFLDAHLTDLVDRFSAEFTRAGGPALDRSRLQQALEVQIVVRGLGTMLPMPRAVLQTVPDPDQAADCNDPLFIDNWIPRAMLKGSRTFLHMWYRFDLGRWLRGESAGEQRPALSR